MRVIDLLNKIANGEELPKKIKYEKHIYKYEEGTYDWSYCIQNNGAIKFLLTDVFNSNDNILNILNGTVEILEEEKKIPEKIEYYDDSIAWVIDDVGQLSDVDKVIIDKLNDVIDYLKSKGDK